MSRSPARPAVTNALILRATNSSLAGGRPGRRGRPGRAVQRLHRLDPARRGRRQLLPVRHAEHPKGVRVVDAGSGVGHPSRLGGSVAGPNGTVRVQVTGRGGVLAAGVSAVVLNVTVVSPTKRRLHHRLPGRGESADCVEPELQREADGAEPGGRPGRRGRQGRAVQRLHRLDPACRERRRLLPVWQLGLGRPSASSSSEHSSTAQGDEWAGTGRGRAISPRHSTRSDDGKGVENRHDHQGSSLVRPASTPHRRLASPTPLQIGLAGPCLTPSGVAAPAIRTFLGKRARVVA